MKKLIFLFLIFNLQSAICNLYAQWVQQPEPVSTPLYNVEFVNLLTGWVTGNSSVILKTTDGGLNWFTQSIDLGYPKSLYGLDMIDANTGYIAGRFETILKTTNGGVNWNILSNIPSNNGNSNHSCSFVNSQTGWICSSLGRVLRTTNGGVSWDTSFANGTLRDIQFLDTQTGWICGDGGSLYKSTNGGLSWVNPPLLTTANLLSLHFINVNTGWTVSEQGRRIFRTTNAGLNWDTVAVLPGMSTDFLYSVHFVNPLTGWTGGSNSLLYKTTNGGFNWYQQSVPVPLFVWNFCFLNDTVGWATGGNQGIIIHTTNGGTYLGIEPISNIIPKTFNLFQNYPNPFNPVTKIRFQISNATKVKLVIFDMLGREIEVLIDENLKTGIYETEWDAGKFSSGVYFYRLITDHITLTKKMILIK